MFGRVFHSYKMVLHSVTVRLEDRDKKAVQILPTCQKTQDTWWQGQGSSIRVPEVQKRGEHGMPVVFFVSAYFTHFMQCFGLFFNCQANIFIQIWIFVCAEIWTLRKSASNNFLLHCFILYCTALHCTAPHHNAPHRTALHRTAPHCTILDKYFVKCAVQWSAHNCMDCLGAVVPIKQHAPHVTVYHALP